MSYNVQENAWSIYLPAMNFSKYILMVAKFAIFYKLGNQQNLCMILGSNDKLSVLLTSTLAIHKIPPVQPVISLV
jgi:hypothetical protein